MQFETVMPSLRAQRSSLVLTLWLLRSCIKICLAMAATKLQDCFSPCGRSQWRGIV